MEFGPQQMTLGTDLLPVLTGGDAAGLMQLLSREAWPQADGYVAISVNGASPSLRVGTSCLLSVTSNGNTALHLVASRGHAELAAFICGRAPSLVATRNRCLDTPLHCAAKAGHREVAACLLTTMRSGGAEEMAALRGRNCLGATALYEAVRHGRAGVVALLLTEAPELASLATEDGFSPLYLAVSTDHSANMVRALLRPLRDGTPSLASFSGPEGRTALHIAATINKEMAQEILDWKPQGPMLLTKVDWSGRTPLQFAALYGRFDVVELFLSAHASGEQARIPDNHGLFPVHTGAMVGRTRIIDELIKKCPDYYELVDDQGRNLLHCAIEHNQEKVVRHICQNSSFPMLLNAMDYEGNTPLHLAVKYGFPRIVSLLLQTMTVKIDITNKDGLTAGDLGRRALAPGRWYYFLDPPFVVLRCLHWSRATVTVDGTHALCIYRRPTYSLQNRSKLTEEEASNEAGSLTKTGTIASVLIATVAFAAAFTVPGGFIADDHPNAGTAILARRFAFRAFVVSDTMAFLCSIIATCFFIYGGAKEIPHNHRFWYNVLGSWLVPVGALFMIASFSFGFHLVLGDCNRWFIVFVYTMSQASVVLCFPSIWISWDLGLWKAIWRRAGWRGLVNIHKRPSS
ncbi:hypothetical protein EJB05_31106, partial [Eragrostis curvula]